MNFFEYPQSVLHSMLALPKNYLFLYTRQRFMTILVILGVFHVCWAFRYNLFAPSEQKGFLPVGAFGFTPILNVKFVLIEYDWFGWVLSLNGHYKYNDLEQFIFIPPPNKSFFNHYYRFMT